mmetsp:Transcript_14428/g.36788  ORF Transcript_14428/g.36788 Transcript_14428/m.36788 type:complete len:238 (-) Transcript_14428:310-1023(-)
MHHQYQAHFYKQWFDKESGQRDKRTSGLNFGNGKTRITAGTDYNGTTTSPTLRDNLILSERNAERDSRNLKQSVATQMRAANSSRTGPYGTKRLQDISKGVKGSPVVEGVPVSHAKEQYERAQKVVSSIRQPAFGGQNGGEGKFSDIMRKDIPGLRNFFPHQQHHHNYGWQSSSANSSPRQTSRVWGEALNYCEKIGPVHASVKGRPQNEVEARFARLERSGFLSPRQSRLSYASHL